MRNRIADSIRYGIIADVLEVLSVATAIAYASLPICGVAVALKVLF